MEGVDSDSLVLLLAEYGNPNSPQAVFHDLRDAGRMALAIGTPSCRGGQGQ